MSTLGGVHEVGPDSPKAATALVKRLVTACAAAWLPESPAWPDLALRASFTDGRVRVELEEQGENGVVEGTLEGWFFLAGEILAKSWPTPHPAPRRLPRLCAPID